MNVATTAELVALERRVRILEAQAARTGSGWMRLSESPLGARKLRRLIAAGKIQASKVGRLLFVRVDDVDRFLAARVLRRDPKKPKPVETADAATYAEANLHLLRAAG